MLRRCPGLLTAWLLVLISTSALAQGGRSEINGTVFDSAKAVMPGVTVEAASPTLIEKSRSVVTDGAGQYRIADLRPGAVLQLVALDPGAPADLPAWCRLTGHALLAADHPVYLIRRKER